MGNGFDERSGEHTPAPLPGPQWGPYNGGPWWAKFIQNVGVPSAMAFALLAGIWFFANDFGDRVVATLEKLSDGVDNFSDEQRTTNDKLDDLIRDHR